ncbi:MAG: hypothetical protein F6K41_09155 [Symploca sp. SIO3E6]|nr:hypothetical protein [Caldora sp. SIO3E6]
MNSLNHAYLPEDSGVLVFDLKQEDKQVLIEYADDGQGIPYIQSSKVKTNLQLSIIN